MFQRQGLVARQKNKLSFLIYIASALNFQLVFSVLEAVFSVGFYLLCANMFSPCALESSKQLSKCTMMCDLWIVPERGIEMKTLSGEFAVSKSTMHFYSLNPVSIPEESESDSEVVKLGRGNCTR